MNNITYAVSVDVNNPIIPYNVYVASVLDSNVRYLEITLYENGNSITLSNTATATASLVTDNVLVNGSVNCTISHSIITVPLEGLQRHGNLDVQVKVTEGTKVLAIPFPIQVRVTPNIAENAQIDENSLGSYAEVVHEIAEARGTYTTLHDAIATKLSAAPGAVDTENLADESITVEKVADDLAAVINAKMDADDATVYHVDTTTQTLTYDNTNPKTIYLNARVSYGSVSNRAAIVISTSSKSYQFAITVTGDILMRSGGGIYPTDWTVLYGSSYKKNSINDDNKNSSIFIPTIGAVVSYLVANYIGNGSGTVTENNLATALKNSLYRVDNTTENVVYNAANPRTIYTNARVNGNKPTLIFTLGNDTQLAMYKDGNLYCRTYANGAYGSWIDLKATSIGESNKTSGAYPTVQAVYNFVTAFVTSSISGKANTTDVNTALNTKEDLPNKVPNRAAMDNLNSETQYPSIKTMVQYTDEKVLGVIDSTLSTQGAAADAKTTGDKIHSLESLNESYNLYDPTYNYTIINVSGESNSSYHEYIINPDGSITCTACAQINQRLLRNSSITLPAGTYTISGKMTLNDNVTDTTAQRLVRCRIGINATVKDVALTTERGGDINVATNAAAGWFAATFDLAQAEPLSFEMIPYYAAYGGTDHPCIISDLLVLKGDGMGLYSDNTAIPADLRARYRIDQLATDVDNRIEQTQLAIDQLATDVDDRIDQLAVQGTDNRFRFSGTFSGGVKSGVTITRLGSNRLILNGTATAGFNLEFAFHSFVISPLTLYYQMHSDDTETGRFWLTNGYFDANNAPHQLSPSISALNEWVKVVYPPSAVDSRTYLHVESGAVFNNTEITLFAVPSVISIDIRDAIDRDVLHNTFIADYNTADYQTAVDNYNAALVATGGDTEQFLFFTDPHLAVQTGGVGGMKPITEQYINLMQAVYNAAPLSYCICGGDWLGNGDTPATAASKLSYIDGFCGRKFRNFLPVIGNHDTNYQGTARFSVDMIKNLTQKTRDQQRLYYRYDTPTARLYVFDTGTENEAVGTYQNSQLEWFANSLDTEGSAHIILTMHIVYYSPTNLQAIQPISDKILEIAAAYNARGTVTVNGTAHDYSAATGTVSFCVAGHTHFDHESVVRTIPVVLTTNATAGNTCTFDLCLADWAAKKLYLKRVGSGSDREVNIL